MYELYISRIGEVKLLTNIDSIAYISLYNMHIYTHEYINIYLCYPNSKYLP